MDDIIKKAFNSLYPEKNLNKKTILKYSKAFKGYNANVRYSQSTIEFRLSSNWKDVSEEITIGLIQSLLNKVYKTSIDSINIEMYNIFLKKVHLSIPKNTIDPELKESFDRINDKYFIGMMMIPNLIWGKESFRKLGSYDYGTDTITISKILQGQDIYLDYVMYHELLHKKLKFKEKNGKNYHHTKEFKELEKKYAIRDIEEKLTHFLKKRRSSGFRSLF